MCLCTPNTQVTGFIIHGLVLGYFIYATMPWVKTGANLTLTIWAEHFARGYFDDTEYILVQWDRASDNVAVTSFFFCWYLLGAQAAGARLSRVRTSRLCVHHTHNDVDQRFSTMSRFFFRVVRGCYSRHNCHTLTAIEAGCREAHAGELDDFRWLGGCWDFDHFFRDVKCKGIDAGIQKPLVLEFFTLPGPANKGKVFYRMQKRMGLNVEWTKDDR